MSESYGGGGTVEPGETATGEGKVQTAKQELAAVDEAAVDAAGDVVETAKDEAASVAHEAKVQVHDLYLQTRDELTDQAVKQQDRIAFGLHSVGDELDSMARNSDGTGIASDLVQRASDRLSDAASWLDVREPADVLGAAKAFARRRPVTFIIGAVVLGAAVGRLTRALASGAAESSGASQVRVRKPHAAVPVGSADRITPTTTREDEGEQLYTELAGQYGGRQEGSDERRDAF